MLCNSIKIRGILAIVHLRYHRLCRIFVFVHSQWRRNQLPVHAATLHSLYLGNAKCEARIARSLSAGRKAEGNLTGNNISKDIAAACHWSGRELISAFLHIYKLMQLGSVPAGWAISGDCDLVHALTTQLFSFPRIIGDHLFLPRACTHAKVHTVTLRFSRYPA